MANDSKKPRRGLLDRLRDKAREFIEDLVEAVDTLIEPPRAPVPIRPGRR
jgi:hypothetical protein